MSDFKAKMHQNLFRSWGGGTGPQNICSGRDTDVDAPPPKKKGFCLLRVYDSVILCYKLPFSPKFEASYQISTESGIRHWGYDPKLATNRHYWF